MHSCHHACAWSVTCALSAFAPGCPDRTPDSAAVLLGREVRRQTCDLISLLQSAHNASHYFMFMEDDFRWAGPSAPQLSAP